MAEHPPVTQDMVALYDRYTHVTLDRRRLMDGLARLAGSAAAAAAILPLLEADAALAAIIAVDDARITGMNYQWQAVGVSMSGYLARPAKVKRTRAAIMVIHENRGLNDHIRDVARRVALAGYTALAPDFLSMSGGTPADEDDARTAIGKLDRTAIVAQSVATVEHLGRKLSKGRVGAVGFCWGGGMTNATAVAAGERLKAAVPFYGPVPGDLSQVTRISAAVQAHYAGLDERINAGIAGYDAALTTAGAVHEIHIYPGVNHAFHNDTSAARYDKAAAELAWGRTLDWFRDKLG